MKSHSILIIITLFLTCSITSVLACDCLANITGLSERINKNSNIFKGKVTNIVLSQDPGVQFGAGYNQIYFDEITNVKGVNDNKTIYYTATNSATCGVSFTQGEEWIIYVTMGDDKKMNIGLCSPSSRYSSSNAENVKEISQLLILIGSNGPITKGANWQKVWALGLILMFVMLLLN